MKVKLFDDPIMWSTTEKVCNEWVGTPYRHLQLCKGRGSDCTVFVGAIFKEVNILTGLPSVTWFAPDWSVHTNEPVLTNLVNTTFKRYIADGLVANYFSVSGEDYVPVRGDLAVFRTRPHRPINHSGLVMDDGTMLHLREGSYIRPVKMNYAWLSTLAGYYRIFRRSTT